MLHTYCGFLESLPFVLFFNDEILSDVFYLPSKVNTVSFKSIEIPKKVFGRFDNIFHVYLRREFQKYERNGILMIAV